MKKVAVVLSGCGFKDGAEITEAISTLIALGEAGANYQCFAPNQSFQSTAHAGTPPDAGQTRNILSESARICRGDIKDLKDLKEKDFDAVVFPGGYGAALHLSNWAQVGAKATLNVDVERVIKEFHASSKPIGAICIAPTLVAKVLGSRHVNVTIGNDKETAAEIEKTGAQHAQCSVDDYISDRDNKVLTTPAYMYESKPHLVFRGINKMIRELVEMA